jgi:predicted secreted hydrolase
VRQLATDLEAVSAMTHSSPLLILLLLGSLLCAASSVAGSKPPRIDGPCSLRFPADHGPHPEHIIEWWYYTGNLESKQGRPFGFELTFFRSRILAEGSHPEPRQPSSWRTDQVWAAHFAISDISEEAFHQSERIMRGAMGLAGAKREEDVWQLNVRDWQVVIGPEKQGLQAQTRDMGLDLELQPGKGPILHGNQGYSQKGTDPASASCYVSFPRLHGSGELRLGKRTFEVTGNAWMDHEFASALLEKGLEGWDWFSLQFADGTELMLFFLRRKEGGVHPASAGTFVDRAGRARHIASDEMELEVLDRWRSPQTGIHYPSGWRLHIGSIGLKARVEPRMENQEMRTESTSGRIYWEGSVSAQGSRGAKEIRGTGYVELTGYGKPFEPLGTAP